MKYLITWFARKGIQYDPSSYCGYLQRLLANQGGLINRTILKALKTIYSQLFISFTQQLSIVSVHVTTIVIITLMLIMLLFDVLY